VGGDRVVLVDGWVGGWVCVSVGGQVVACMGWLVSWFVRSLFGGWVCR
jgi:hypothetical protein